MTRRKQLESLGAILLLLVVVGRLQRNWYFVYAGVALVLTGLFWRRAAVLLSLSWMKLGKLIGAITGRVLLTLVFVLVVLPISIVARRKDWLGIRMRRERRTHFKDRAHLFERADLQDPW
jgi:hypothetical protein